MGDHAERLGCLPSDISKIERGEEPVSEDFISETVKWLEEFDNLSNEEIEELSSLAYASKTEEKHAEISVQLDLEFSPTPYQQLQQLRKLLTRSAAGSRSQDDLRRIALRFLDCFGLRDRLILDWLHILEYLLSLVDPDYYLLVYPTTGDEPPCYSESHGDVAKRIVLSDHAYLELRKKEPQLIFLAAHELSHWLLHAKTLHYSRKLQPAEIEANALAVEILLPKDVVRQCDTEGHLAMMRRVDRELAQTRMKLFKLGRYRKKKPANKKLTTKQRTAPPRTEPESVVCFISYAHESEKHQKWVTKLANALQDNGVRANFDRWDIKLGALLPQYMQRALKTSSHVVLVCTPMFAAKADTEREGVGYETSIVTAAIFDSYYAERPDDEKFIPVLRSGDYDTAIPSFLRGRVYVDMRDDREFEAKLEELLRHMFRTPLVSRPPLGRRPHFAR